MASPEMIAKLSTTAQSLDTAARWFRSQVSFWRRGGPDLLDGAELIAFDQGGGPVDLDTFMTVIEASRDTIIEAMNAEVANDV